jgi:hypothetical protein
MQNDISLCTCLLIETMLNKEDGDKKKDNTKKKKERE